MSTSHKVTIITINYNDHAGLRKTIESVVAQSFRDFEYVVVDGGSTDGSVDVIKQYDDEIDQWVSEKDKGIYNAMNKGIRIATGEYLLFLNSGDFLVDNDTLLRSSAFLDGAIDLAYGSSVMKKETVEYIRTPSSTMRFSEFITRKGPHHQSSFIKRSLFSEIGLYNEDYRILADWDFFLKVIFRYEKKIKYLPFNVSCFDLQGMSSDEKNKGQLHGEKERIIKEYYPRFAEDYHELLFYKNLVKNSRVIRAYLKYFKRIDPEK